MKHNRPHTMRELGTGKDLSSQNFGDRHTEKHGLPVTGVSRRERRARQRCAATALLCGMTRFGPRFSAGPAPARRRPDVAGDEADDRQSEEGVEAQREGTAEQRDREGRDRAACQMGPVQLRTGPRGHVRIDAARGGKRRIRPE